MEGYPIPEFTGDPADDLSFDLAGETYLHGCRILAAGRAGARLEVHLLAGSIDQLNLAAPLRAPAAAASESLALDSVPALDGVSSVDRLPALPGESADQPLTLSLAQRLVFTFADEDEAISEAIVVDHWGENGILVEGHISGVRQGVLLFDPATGISTGVRLPLGD